MSGLSFSVIASGQDDVERRLGKLFRRMGDLTPLMSILAGFMRDSTRQRFEDGVDPDGKAWVPSIRARLTGGRTMLDHGILRDSIADDYGSDFAAVGTNDPRAKTLHFGARIEARSAEALVFQLPGAGWRRVKAVTIPARPIFGLSRADGAEIGNLIQDYIEEAAA